MYDFLDSTQSLKEEEENMLCWLKLEDQSWLGQRTYIVDIQEYRYS